MGTWLRSFIQALPVMFFDWMALDGQPCHAYGGQQRHVSLKESPEIAFEVRLCTKNRWHSDSHAYEFVKFPYTYPKEV